MCSTEQGPQGAPDFVQPRCIEVIFYVFGRAARPSRPSIGSNRQSRIHVFWEKRFDRPWFGGSPTSQINLHLETAATPVHPEIARRRPAWFARCPAADRPILVVFPFEPSEILYVDQDRWNHSPRPLKFTRKELVKILIDEFCTANYKSACCL
jgi:hypothetical protein